MSTLLECRKLTKRFKTKEVLKQIDLKLESGHIIGVLGPNGSGKTMLIKMINGLLVPSGGELLFCGENIGVSSKRSISYLPDQTYLNMNQRVRDVIAFFHDFYEDFEQDRALDMLKKLNISVQDSLKTLSKGTKEKVQLVLVLSNYEPEASVLISTHLISDIENILDEVVFIQDGRIVQHASVDDIRSKEGKSVDAYFREVFRC